MSNKDRWLINYSQCWEDTALMIKALDIIRGDCILSITSGGDNSLAMINHSPAKLIAVDNNPNQNYLFRLKLAAIRTLNTKELNTLLGLDKEKDRISLYKGMARTLDNKSRLFWDKNTELLKKGIIHSGKFETYLNYFRKYFLSMLYSKKVIGGLLEEKTVEEQIDYYNTSWDKLAWRLLFRLFFSKWLMSRIGRGRGMFDFNKYRSVGEHYLEKTKSALSGKMVFNNCYMDYILEGVYHRNLPLYLEDQYLAGIKDSLCEIETADSSLIDYIRGSDSNTITKFNLSDIFEKMTPDETREAFSEILRVAKNDARIIFWNNMVSRDIPEGLAGNFKREIELEEELIDSDRVFFYDSFKIYSIKK